MKKLGMVYQYSYEEQWQPKDIPVLFRLYQMDLDGNSGRPYPPILGAIPGPYGGAGHIAGQGFSVYRKFTGMT